MSRHYGDFAVGTTIHMMFTTVGTDGAPTQLAGTPVVDVYEDDSITQITAGETLTVDFDSVTGLNHLTIAATGGNGYEAGKTYHAVITTGTVGGTSVVGYVVGSFTIEKVSALRPTTAGNTLDVNATGEAGLDLDNTSGTLAAAQFATGFITAAKFAAGAIDAAAIGTGAIDADSIAANALTSAKIATDAIGAAQLAADAVTEITDDIMAETLTEPSQAIPPTTGVADVADALRYLYFALTNRVDVDDTAGAKEFYNRAESAVQWKKAISDTGSIYTEDTGAAGP